MEKPLNGQTEQDLYRMLDLPYIEPEMREDRGEIEAAASGTLPEIIPYGAVRGDLHVHSSWSDGKHSISELAEAAKVHGYEYIAVCDHAWNPKVSRGLDETAIVKQQAEIERVNRDLDGFVVLGGIECSIGPSGNLDIGDKIIGDLDVVVAGIHSDLDMTPTDMTNRVLAALHNDQVDILGHPTGRIIQQREPVQMDLDAVFDSAGEQGVSLEINAFPSRLDLSDTNCRMAREHGARFSICSDAHAREMLDFMKLGIATARRGWLEAKDIINTLPLRGAAENAGIVKDRPLPALSHFNTVFSAMEKSLAFLSWRGNCDGDPLSPQRGGSMRGQAPLTPMAVGFSFYAAEGTIHSHAPRGEPRRGGERPWSHRYPIPVPSFSFLTSMISTKAVFSRNGTAFTFQVRMYCTPYSCRIPIPYYIAL